MFAVVAYPPPVDFGAVQVGSAALRTLAVPAGVVAVTGVGFSATRAERGVLVVYEPYEPGEGNKGVLVLRLGSRVVHIPLRGRGIDTIPPAVTVVTPRAAVAGQSMTVRFSAADNDLVTVCALSARGRVVARLPWPVTSLRWRVPRRLRGPIRITVRAVDRAGNVGFVTRTVRVQPNP